MTGLNQVVQDVNHLAEDVMRLKRDLALLRVTEEKKVTERFSFADIGFCGMWSGRKDMANSSQWVIKQRRGILSLRSLADESSKN